MQRFVVYVYVKKIGKIIPPVEEVARGLDLRSETGKDTAAKTSMIGGPESVSGE